MLQITMQVGTFNSAPRQFHRSTVPSSGLEHGRDGRLWRVEPVEPVAAKLPVK